MNTYTNWTEANIERNAGGAMTISQASQIVHLGGGIINASLMYEAREIVRLAARSGYTFNNDGSFTPPPYTPNRDADRDEARYTSR